MLMKTRKIDGGTATYNEDPSVKDAVFEKIIVWFIEHHVSLGESLLQNDYCIMEAPELLAELLDDVIEFDIVFEDDYDE